MSEGYDPGYDRDEYLAVERGERAGHPARWMVRGAVKLRILQTRPGTEDDDTDAEVWFRFGWVRGLDKDEDSDEARKAIAAEIAPDVGRLLDVCIDGGNITDTVLDWEVDG